MEPTTTNKTGSIPISMLMGIPTNPRNPKVQTRLSVTVAMITATNVQRRNKSSTRPNSRNNAIEERVFRSSTSRPSIALAIRDSPI